ncbi:MAG: OmpH family outer membrane protein [Desulfobacterales bacterium]|uniref:OmpH family outer membrane protein n=1 Tax=Candidatus Desulfaltia bathyphila TaxID=2841697 RepID=A0A8J6N6W3_9BACT|nr:OmpH family outer membrane protein [Candidatus Desulfaltia bathyphila]MBL7207077.1 OmpH family outer membrane protein [Desulfobacterales bacterium]
MKKSRIAIVVCVVFGLVLCMSSYAMADKVGYVNLQRLVSESKMGKKASKDIQKLRKQKQKVVSAKLKEVNKLRDLINNKGDKMAAAEKRDVLENLQKAYKEYQRLVADAKDDIVRGDRKLVSTILEKANKILKKVAKKYKYTIIIKDPNAVGYLDPDVDITDKVIKELNKKK